MRLSEFNFKLPSELIAKYPIYKRDESRLLYFEGAYIQHRKFKDIADLLQPGDLLVRNISKVMPARFYIRGHGAEIEILLTEQQTETVWQALANPAKKLKAPWLEYSLANDQTVKVAKNLGVAMVDFGTVDNFNRAIAEVGLMPIPPYIKRKSDEVDKERYQTIYAQDRKDGQSIAAPTAGLHFTDELIGKLNAIGVEIVDLCLHVGLGTFEPIRSEDVADHEMHPESYSIEESVWHKILAAKAEERRVIAVGTTTTRVLESVAITSQLAGNTNLYIYPGNHEFKIIDGLLTNFHLPQSSLYLLVCAFLGPEVAKRIYMEAIKEQYRFYSYGDACLFIK